MSERTVTVRLRALITDYQKAMQTASGESRKFAQVVKGNFTQLNADVGRLGETMTRRVTLPLAGLGVGAVKLAGDFETTFGQMVGLAGVAASEVDGLRESVLKLSADTARGPNELAQALYFIRSSGVAAADAMSVLEVAAKASAAGLGSTVVIADAVTSAMNAYGAANLSAQQATDVLVAAVREGKTEASELAPVLGILIPTAAAMGISFSQVAGVLAVMSRTGLDAAEASTSLNAIFSTLLGTSKEGVDALAEHGLSLKSLRDTAAGPGGLVEVMRILDRTFADNDEALAQVIPNVRAFRGVMNVLAQDGASVDQVMQNVANSTGDTNDAFAAMKATEAFKTKQAIVDLQIALLKLGAAIQPFVTQFANGFADIGSALSTLPHWLQEIGVMLGIIAVVAGPAMKAISMIGTVAAPGIKLAINALKALRAEIIANQVAGMSYGRSLAAALVPVGVTLSAVAVAVAGAAIIWNDYNNKKQRTIALTQQLTSDLENEAEAANKLSSIHIGEDLLTGGLGEALREAQAFLPILTDTVKQGSPVLTQALKDLSIGIDEVEKNLLTAAKAGDPLAQELLRIGRTGALTSAEFVQLIKLLGTQSGAYQIATRDAGNAAYATGQLGDATKVTAAATASASTSVDTMAAATAGLAADATVAENALKALLGTLNSLYAGAFDVMDAQQGFADALGDVDAGTRSAGGSTRDYAKEQRDLEKATEDVADAQKDLADAEAALIAARKGATPREKGDAALDVREAQLGVKEAIKAQADARKRLAEEQKKGAGGDAAGARLDLERTAISLKRAQDRLTDAQAAQNKVLHSGEETSEKVTAALEDLETAQDRVRDATERQMDAEATLRGEGASGGPVADRARQIRSSYNNLVTAAENWITKLVEQKRPTDEIVAALDEQSVAAQKLIDAYGDPDGKLAKFIENNERLRLIFTDDKFMTNFGKAASWMGGLYGVVIPDFLGSDATGPAGRASGGPVGVGATVRITEQGDEFLTMGNKPGYVSTAAQMARADLTPIGGSSGGGDTNYSVNVRVGGSVMVNDLETIVMRAVRDGARRTGGIPYAGRR